jgi:hypothetical protein
LNSHCTSKKQLPNRGKTQAIESGKNTMPKNDRAFRADLAICSNCGFSAASADAFINEDIQRRKLAAIAATAQRVWGTA